MTAWRYVILFALGVLAGIGFVIANKAHAETITLGPNTCSIEWDSAALWITCDLAGTDLTAPETEDFWNRTGIELYIGKDPRPWKLFCTLDGDVKDTGDMVYPTEHVTCTSDGKNRIETGLAWAATPYQGEAGETIHYGLKLNAYSAADGRLPSRKTPENLRNDPATFASLTLTADNLRSPTIDPPAQPALDETGLVLTWDPQDDAEWWWVYIDRDGDSLERTRAGTNELALDDYITQGTARYVFTVTAEAGGLEESAPSDPLQTWIVKLATTGLQCPPVIPCPECPACPPAVVCPPVAECPPVTPPIECPDCPEVTPPDCPDSTVQVQSIEVITRCR